MPDPDAAVLPGRVLVVEDSMIIALDTEETLEQLGAAALLPKPYSRAEIEQLLKPGPSPVQ